MEIAQALDVNVRSAQRFERERGLPVRRSHGGRGRVAIETAALEAWKHQSTPHGDTACFRWPVDRDMIAEGHFVGAAVRAMHVQRLQQYLELVKTALE